MGSGQANVKAYNRQLRDLIIAGRAKPSFVVAQEIPCRRMVGEGSEAAVLALGPHRTPRRGRERQVPAAAGLDAGLLVRGQDVLVLAKGPALPFPLVEVQHAGGLLGEPGVAGEDPRPVLSGLQRVVGKPVAHRGR